MICISQYDKDNDNSNNINNNNNLAKFLFFWRAESKAKWPRTETAQHIITNKKGQSTLHTLNKYKQIKDI
jgi:hypothetical protein